MNDCRVCARCVVAVDVGRCTNESVWLLKVDGWMVGDGIELAVVTFG